MPGVLERVLGEIDRRGPLPYSEVMEAALYDPEHGFYAAGGRAGRQGDFLTSPEVGPLFGVVVGRALDAWWEELGRPDPYVVIDAGAGPGTLARSVLAADPSCAAALRYVLVERSEAQRATHPERLRLEDPVLAFAADPDDDDTGEAARAPEPPPGPIAVSLRDLPRVHGPCVVIANELLDNLPFDLARRGADGWEELRVGTGAGGLTELTVPLDAVRGRLLDRLAPDAEPGSRVPLQDAAGRWLRDALGVAAPGGRVVVLDYGATTAELAVRPWTEWLRTYRRHERGGSPLDDLGGQDVTCEVATDQLAAVRPPVAHRTQAEWLREHGIVELVAEGKRTWAERAGVGDLEAVRARSRVGEAEALTDPAGLGSFRVLEWSA